MSKLSDSDNNKIKQVFEWIKSHVTSSDEKKRVLDNEEKIKAMFRLDSLKENASYVPLFFEMLKANFSGKYTEVPVGTIATIIGTLLYVFSPIDVVPDFLPGVGLLDDAAMMALCVATVKLDVDKYKEWKANQDDLADGFKEI